jgi:hypothetical protein
MREWWLRKRSYCTDCGDACWVESVNVGWLFMLNLGGGVASLIFVGGTADELLAGSRLVAPRVEKCAA